MKLENNSSLIVVSNRLPVQITRVHDKLKVERGSGGLVTAMNPVLKEYSGHWLGWPGTTDGEDITDELHDLSVESGFTLHTVDLSAREMEHFYHGFSNEIIWPLFHDLQTRANFVPEYWKTYKKVNKKFADASINISNEEDFLWIHDYHLMHVAKYIREQGIKRKLAFFLHIPFPSVDIFSKLPWRKQILEALLEYDLIGFQTAKDRRNFLTSIRVLLPEAKIKGRGLIIPIIYKDRYVKTGRFSISIDFNEFSKGASESDITQCLWYLKKQTPEWKIILGLDRLDYTKGIPEKLNSFREALRQYPELKTNVTLVQLVIPSRSGVSEYRELKHEIEQLVGEINGEFASPGWVPIHYFYQKLDRKNLYAFYRSASIALITSLRDGMNLVAKEYCACNQEHDGVLILSEFAGAAPQFKKEALIVNPYDIEGVAAAIYQAYKMLPDERAARMKKMRKRIKKYDIYYWLQSFINAGSR